MPFSRKGDGGSNYKCANFEDQERRLGSVTMDIVFEPSEKVQNENRKILMISLGTFFPCHFLNSPHSTTPLYQTEWLNFLLDLRGIFLNKNVTAKLVDFFCGLAGREITTNSYYTNIILSDFPTGFNTFLPKNQD